MMHYTKTVIITITNLKGLILMQSLSQNRGSKQRSAILRVLKGTDTHPSAEWVYHEVRREIPNISLGTVYRNLAQLADSGEIQRMEIGDGVDRFDFNELPHYHMFCHCCKRLLDLALPYDKTMDSRTEEFGAGDISYHALIFYGTCSDCLSQTEKEFHL